jgi:hypothetical protein
MAIGGVLRSSVWLPDVDNCVHMKRVEVRHYWLGALGQSS